MIPTTCCWFHDILNFEMNTPTSCCGDTSFGLCLPNYYVLGDFHGVFWKISSWTIMDDSHKLTSIDPFFHTQLVYQFIIVTMKTIVHQLSYLTIVNHIIVTIS